MTHSSSPDLPAGTQPATDGPAAAGLSDADIKWDMRHIEPHLKDADAALPALLHGVRKVISRALLNAAPPGALAELIDVQLRLDREESDHGLTIDQRDNAEEALGRMFQAVTGRPAEWSSAWGYADAIVAVEEHVAAHAQRHAPSAPVDVPPEDCSAVEWLDFCNGNSMEAVAQALAQQPPKSPAGADAIAWLRERRENVAFQFPDSPWLAHMDAILRALAPQPAPDIGSGHSADGSGQISARDRAIWRAGMTLAHNLCVQESDQLNDADGPMDAINAANDCARRIREFVEPETEQLAAMFAEADVPETTPTIPDGTGGRAATPPPSKEKDAMTGTTEWVLVPRKPTPAQQAALLPFVHRMHQARGLYAAMLAAAPKPSSHGADLAWADLPWRAATGWLRSASGSKIIEVGGDGITQRESELIAAAVNAYTAAQGSPTEVEEREIVEHDQFAAIVNALHAAGESMERAVELARAAHNALTQKPAAPVDWEQRDNAIKALASQGASTDAGGAASRPAAAPPVADSSKAKVLERLVKHADTLPPLSPATVDGWRLVIRQGERDTAPGIWATDGKTFVWVAEAE